MSAPAAMPALRGGRIAWQLSQTLWVGGAWVLHFVLMPALQQYGLAPRLQQDLAEYLYPLMTGFAAVCIALQLALAAWVLRGRFWSDLRVQLLLLAAVACAAFFVLRELSELIYLGGFAYLVMAFAGLVLLLQRRPDEG